MERSYIFLNRPDGRTNQLITLGTSIFALVRALLQMKVTPTAEVPTMPVPYSFHWWEECSSGNVTSVYGVSRNLKLRYFSLYFS